MALKLFKLRYLQVAFRYRRTKTERKSKNERSGRAGIEKTEPIHRDREETSDPTQAAEDSELKRQKIEFQINEAIRLRAISGVTVYFVPDTAHLKGRVDTASQKSAAEKAARSIRGVKEVRSSIEVNFLSLGTASLCNSRIRPASRQSH